MRVGVLILLLAGLVLLLVACASALAAGPMVPVTAPATSTSADGGVEAALARPLASPTSSRVPATQHPTTPAPAATPNSRPTLSPTAPATATPTAQDKAEPTLGAFSITPVVGATLVTPNPTAVQPVEIGNSVVNVLLIGTDYRATDPTFRTDTLIIASINKDAATVSLLSIPRDLYVYVPKYGMARINLAYKAATSNGFPGGGPALLQQTILYNLGIPIHYYALVNFDGFRQIVDTLGGIDVPVNCQLTEYKLKDPTLDERDAANYELYTQPAGVAHMDGALALWYARARPVGGDFFRGYRQRQVLRAIYRQALSANVIPHLPELYGQYHAVVDTDMGLWDVMQFVPLTARLDEAQIRSLHIGPNQTSSWATPKGEAVLLPRPEALSALVAEFFADPSANRLARPVTWVEIVNGAPGVASEALAAETLRNEGFGVTFGPPPAEAHATTTLVDLTTSAKGSPVKRLQSVLHVPDDHVLAQPEAGSPVQFRVILGADYNACPRLDWMDTSAATATSSP